MDKTIISSSILTKLEDLDLPSIIYKYRTWENDFHKRFVTEREVFLASPNTFEDELDCRNPVRFDLLNNKQIFDFYFNDSKKINPTFNRTQHREFAKTYAKTASFRNKNVLESWQNKSFNDYCSRTGILSLTENCNNASMWEKYADNGNGICIGYNTHELFKLLGGGGPVVYMDNLPIILPHPYTSHEEFLFRKVYCKTTRWAFEEEYRTKKFWTYNASMSDRQVKLPNICFAEIILGDNLSEENIKDITDKVKYHIGSIQIIKREDL